MTEAYVLKEIVKHSGANGSSADLSIRKANEALSLVTKLGANRWRVSHFYDPPYSILQQSLWDVINDDETYRFRSSFQRGLVYHWPCE